MGGSITEVAGILVGHAHDSVRGSGVTVLLFPGGAMAVADIRGEAAGTRQMDSLLRPHPVQKIHALVFAGGSAFGLDAASGVVRYLEARNIGFSTPGGIVPRSVPRGIPAGTFFHREYHARGDRHRRSIDTGRIVGGGPYGACGAVQGDTPCPHADGWGHRRGRCHRGFRAEGKCHAGGRPRDPRSGEGDRRRGALRERERVGTRGGGVARKPALIICTGVPGTIVEIAPAP